MPFALSKGKRRESGNLPRPLAIRAGIKLTQEEGSKTMKDLDAILAIILVIIGIGSCSVYNVAKVDAVVTRMIEQSLQVKR